MEAHTGTHVVLVRQAAAVEGNSIAEAVAAGTTDRMIVAALAAEHLGLESGLQQAEKARALAHWSSTQVRQRQLHYCLQLCAV